MPFRLRLKKSRQYTVSSKNLFVLSVELLDNTAVECTLSAQSLGQECLNNVCQRLGLQQAQYFGLRFISKKGTPWWVNLERPLKKQLDKYALDSHRLLLGVMFYVPDVNILNDEVTRYHYFLQLKSDILDGKLCCNEEQTILFASYSLQAEFGDHDPERHTTEYLTNFVLLPKHVDKERQEAMLERVILNHRSLQGMSQQLAEVYYIMEAQRLENYGIECFPAKDSSHNPIIVGVFLYGIHIFYGNNQPSPFFYWDQILNLVHHKQYFRIEHRSNPKILQCCMEDSHLAKYVLKTCIQQHNFFTKNENLVRAPSVLNHNPTPAPPKVESQPQFTMQESQDSIDGLGTYPTERSYSERLNASKSCSELPKKPVMPPPPSEPSRAQSSASLAQPVRRASDVSSHMEPRPVCPVLPIYRQAPDYDTAIKLKYGLQSCSTGDMSTSHLYAPPVEFSKSYSHYKNYPDLSHPENVLVRNQEFVSAPSLHPPVHTYGSPDLVPSGEPVVYHYKPPPPYPYKQRSSSSTPDLSRNVQPVSSHPSAIYPQPGAGGMRTCDLQPSHSYEPIPIPCTTIVTSTALQHQSIASSQRVAPPQHAYENCQPQPPRYMPPQSQPFQLQQQQQQPPLGFVESSPEINENHQMGPMLVAAMNGLSLSRPAISALNNNEPRPPTDPRIHALESHLSEGQVFLEFESIQNRKPHADFATALLPENASRNRFKDVMPYEESRVLLTPTSENKTGYINASYIVKCVGSTQLSYIAAQGPLPNTLYSFWQMVWEHCVVLIVMLTQVQEQGHDKCFPYWPQEDGKQLMIGEFQIMCNFSMSSPTYITSSLSLCHLPTQQQRSIWHIQYTDWPDHSCPHDTQGFIAFMGEVDAVRRHCCGEGEQVALSPVVVHCSAGVGRSGVVILCDIMLHCLDHNQPVNVHAVLQNLRLQRMMIVQTLAQYKFVYSVLIQYLKNSRLI